MSGDNLKAPSQVFKWFEKMKANYESSIQSVLTKFEQYNNDQQTRIDNSYNAHLESLKAAHAQQLAQNQQLIENLQKDVSYYQSQLAHQQKSTEQLNARYDAVMSTFLEQKKRDINIKEIFADDFVYDEKPKVNEDPVIEVNTQRDNVASSVIDITKNTATKINSTNANISASTEALSFQKTIENQPDDELIQTLYNQALSYRKDNELEEAFALFKQAAKQGCIKSMGALGRAYFLAEGIQEDFVTGLAWLINAAKLGLPQAVKRVQHFEEDDPELFAKANDIVASL